MSMTYKYLDVLLFLIVDKSNDFLAKLPCYVKLKTMPLPIFYIIIISTYVMDL